MHTETSFLHTDRISTFHRAVKSQCALRDECQPWEPLQVCEGMKLAVKGVTRKQVLVTNSLSALRCFFLPYIRSIEVV